MATEEEVKQRVKERLVSGEITKDQARQVLEAWKAQSQPATTETPAEPVEPASAPEVVQPVAPEPVQQDREPTFMDQFQVGSDFLTAGLRGAGETALQFATGAVAEPLAGLAGLAGLAQGPEQAAKAVDVTREALTYQPKTVGGKAVSEGAGRQLEPVGRALEAVEQGAGEAGYAVGGPAVGAVASAVPAAIAEAVGLRGTRQAKRAAIERAVEESGANILTPEAREAIRAQGFTDDDIRAIAARDPQQLERMERFNRLGVQPTRGDITQQLEAQKPEAQLFETAQDEAGASMRQLRRSQTQALTRNVDELIDEAGVPESAGDTIKDALKGRKQLTKEQARAAYDALSEAQDGASMPILIGNVENLEGFPSPADYRSVQRINRSEVNALDDLLAEFGLSDSEKALKRLDADGVTPQPLTLSNFEDFRKGLAAIERSDQTGNLGRLTGPIRRELDKQVDAMSEALETSGNPNVAAAAKEARMNWKAYKEEFDPKSLTEQLIADKPKSIIPQVESSNVYTKIAANATPVEQVDRLVQSLKSAGPKGRKALGDLQASMMMDLLDSSFKGVTRKVDGQPMISGPAMAKRWEKLENKAKIVFQDNPAALRRLQDVVKTSADITPQNIAVPKGSAGYIMDVLQKTGLITAAQAIPGANFLIEGMREIGARSANQANFNRAMKARPDLNRSVKLMATDYPSLAVALGIGETVTQEPEENDPNPVQ